MLQSMGSQRVGQAVTYQLSNSNTDTAFKTTEEKKASKKLCCRKARNNLNTRILLLQGTSETSLHLRMITHNVRDDAVGVNSHNKLRLFLENHL